MKLVIQRVEKASVSVSGKLVGKIDKGLLILLGVKAGDIEKSADILAAKIAKLRIMSDKDGKMNLSIKEAGGSLLVVSQFTLYSDTSKGNRPSFIKAADPQIAKSIYERFLTNLESFGIKFETGKFGEYMKIESVLDGPVTIMLEA